MAHYKNKILQANLCMPDDAFSKAILQNRADQLKVTKTEELAESNQVNYIKFKLGSNESYGIPFLDTGEVIRNVNITPVPYLPDYISGVTNHHGLLLTILDLRKYFKITNEKSRSTLKEIIIIKNTKLTIGIEVGYISGSDVYQPSLLDSISTKSTVVKAEYIVGLDKGKTTILNVEPIMADIERQLKKNILRR